MIKVGDAVKDIMKKTKTTQCKLAELTGGKSQPTIAKSINSNNMKVQTLLEMLDIMGYEMILQPKNIYQCWGRQIKITAGKENEK